MSPRTIERSAQVQKRKLLGAGTYVGPGARLFGDVQTGNGVHIDCNAIIYGPVKIGSRSYVGPNCVLGFPSAAELEKTVGSHKVATKELTVLGENCTVRPGTAIYSCVTIGNNVSFGHNTLVREKVAIGDESKIGTNSVVDGTSQIGKHVWVQTGVYICTYSTVEDGVFLGPCCVFTNDKYVTQKPFKLVGPTVKKGASIGANAVLFPGVTIGEGAVVGSQAMVNTDVPPRTIYAGIPAKKIREMPEEWNTSLLKDR